MPELIKGFTNTQVTIFFFLASFSAIVFVAIVIAKGVVVVVKDSPVLSLGYVWKSPRWWQ